MLVINKKRVKIIVLGVMVALFVFTFQIAQSSKDNKTQNGTVETTATPVSGKTVVIDAGHGVPDEGAQSSSRNNRGTNKFKDSIKSTKITRTKWM